MFMPSTDNREKRGLLGHMAVILCLRPASPAESVARPTRGKPRPGISPGTAQVCDSVGGAL